MGSQNSAEQYNLKIELNKLAYVPGETITGTFNFDLSKSARKKAPIVQNTMVTLELISEESAYYGKLRKQSNTLCNQTVNLPQLLTVNQSTETKIPFQITIPPNAKPSFEWPKEEKLYASLRTFVKISIPDLKAVGARFIIIRKISSPLKSPLEIEEKSHKKGNDVSLKARYPMNSYPFKCQVPLDVIVDFSKSEYKINGINCTLKRKIKFFDSKKKLMKEYIDELDSKEVNGNTNKVQIENFAFGLSDPQEIFKKYYMKRLALVEGLKPNDLIFIMPNIKQNFFECEYYIKVRVNSYNMYVPIDVYSKDNYDTNVRIRRSESVYQMPPAAQKPMAQQPYAQPQPYAQAPNPYVQPPNPFQQQPTMVPNPYQQQPPMMQQSYPYPGQQQQYYGQQQKNW